MEIPLENSHLFTKVDPEDFKKIKEHSWNFNKGFAEGKVNGKTTGLHRSIMNAPEHLVVDLLNHNTLDNRKKNLRVVSVQENAFNHRQNQSLGVHETPFGFVAQMRLDSKLYNLGTYPTAAVARDVYSYAHWLRRYLARSGPKSEA